MKKTRGGLIIAAISAALLLTTACTQNVTNSAIEIEVDGETVAGTYTGVLEDGVPNGEGTFTSNDEKYVYEGTWANGAPSGSGHLYYDGYTLHFTEVDKRVAVVYDGDVVDGVPKGSGTFSGENDKHIKYLFTGEFDNGIMNGQGKWDFDGDNGYTYIGNYSNGCWDPSALELIKSYGTNKGDDIPYTVSDNAEKFIKEHDSIFPCYDVSSILDMVDYNVSYQELAKSTEKYGSNLICLQNYYLNQIFETELEGAKINVFTTMYLKDSNDNMYVVFYPGELPGLYEGRKITCYGVPVAYSSYDNIDGGTTLCVVMLGSAVVY